MKKAISGSKKGAASFGVIVAIVGAVLITLGVAWLIASNWHQIPAFIKIFILLIATAGAYFAGVMLRTHEHPNLGWVLLILGGLLYTLSIFLIAQIFSTSVSLQGIAFLFLLAWVGVLLASYIFNCSGSLVVALGEFLIWLTLQYLAFSETFGREFSPGILALLYLMAGMTFYGLNLLHGSRKHHFSNVYRWWTAFYILAFAYILSFQALLPMLWPEGISLSGTSLAFLIIFGLISLVLFGAGSYLATNKKTTSGREVLAFVGIIVLFILIIGSGSIVSSVLGTCSVKSCYDVSNEDSCQEADLPNSVCEWKDNRCQQVNCGVYRLEDDCGSTPAELECEWQNNYCRSSKVYDRNGYLEANSLCEVNNNDRKSCLSEDSCKWRPNYYTRGGSNIPGSLWAIWIIDNIIFILIILGVIGYGTHYGAPKIVNLGIGFFALDIITRYLGFIFNFWGYTSLSLVFISGGIVLIVGGWLIERWRRKLVTEAKEVKGKKAKVNTLGL
tara:strand:+ start:250 stop:1752 length:1503 start_codon:yes stop_codon:yes gene_type:complete